MMQVRHDLTCRMPRKGMTLIEVILALALTVIVVGMIGSLVGMHSHITDTAKRNVQTSELATAILSLIVEDIRGTQIDYEVIVLNDAALEIPPTEEELAAEEEAAAEEGEAALTEEELEETVLPIGLYGTESYLRFDTAKTRRPGRRWMSPDADPGTSMSPLGELRTVSYAIDIPTSQDELIGILPPGQTINASQPVLYRSERDRAVSAFFTANLGGDDEKLFSQPVATEVASMQFRYYDGETWLTQWDTVEMGGLPLAVEITLLMNPPEGALTGFDDSVTLQTDLTFRRTVQLPNARPIMQAQL